MVFVSNMRLQARRREEDVCSVPLTINIAKSSLISVHRVSKMPLTSNLSCQRHPRLNNLENARPSIRKKLKFKPIPHPPYSPDCAQCDFLFIPLLKRDLKGTHYISDNEVNAAIKSWIREKSEECFNDRRNVFVLTVNMLKNKNMI